MQPIALVDILKWDASQHPRDAEGQFITVGGRQITVVKPQRAATDKLVSLDIPAFDQRFSKDVGFYLGPGGGKNAIGNRYARFGEFIAQNDSIESPEVYIGPDGRVGFTNGRHRYAWLRDQGLTTIPVAMDRESVRNAKKFGYLSTQKWDESQHPRDAKGQFKSSYVPNYGASKDGAFEWPNGRPGPNDLVGPEPVWVQQHRALVGAALQSWAGDPVSFRLHAQDVVAGAPIPPSGSGKQMRAQAEALLYELEHNTVPITVPLYRGSGPKGDQPGNPFSWSEDRKVAAVFAKRYGGKVTTLPANTARGLKLRDYAGDYLGEKQWVVRAGNDPLSLKFDKPKYSYGNTQIAVSPHSSAALVLNMTRDRIQDSHLMAAGKDVDPNHVTVRYGLLNDDLDGLRSFIARQTPFEAQLGMVELFPASEHSDGAVPVVARIYAPELHAIEAEIGKYADFKDKSFPDYKPHCTLAYCTPEDALNYADLFLYGSFLVQSITISHQSGVQETIPFGMTQKWDEAKHPRGVKGQFVTLYHGTRQRDVEAIRREGLKPGAIGMIWATESPEDAQKYAEGKDYPHPTPGAVIEIHAPKSAFFFEKSLLGPKDPPGKRIARFAKAIPPEWIVKREAWDESKHPRNPSGSSEGGEFTSAPKDAMESLLNGEKVSIDPGDVRRLLEISSKQMEEPNLMNLHVDGMRIFDRDGLNIKRDDMPQIPKEHRDRFVAWMKEQGVTATLESVSPLDLLPTQNSVSARNVGEKIKKYERDKHRPFFPVLVSKESRIVDGHHHWAMMAALTIDAPNIKMPILRFNVGINKALALAHVYMNLNHLERKSKSGERVVSKADPVSGRYVTPFVSFDKQGNDALRMIASLNSSRLATWGFTAEAEVLGLTRYKLTAVLDGRTSKFCRMIDGKVFNVSDARRKVIEALNVQDPEDLKVVQPWPKQTKAAMEMYAMMSNEEFVQLGLHIPPFHPYCRTLLRRINASGDEVSEAPVETVPTDVETFQAVTADDLAELGIDATPEDVAAWNESIGMTPVEMLSKLTGMDPQDILTKGQGVGVNPIDFDPTGIGIKARGENTNGVEFKLGALLDPFTGIFYLNQADLMTGTPKAELGFLRNLFTELINAGTKTTATSLAVGVAGNAAYFAKMGFLPDELDWDVLRNDTLMEIESGSLKAVVESLAPDDQLLVKHILQDQSASALSALVELPFYYEGKSIGEYILENAGGTWMLDLNDEMLVDQARAYLS